ncbi:MAG: nucleotidyltransferase family protein, partial [Candidatus Omnitrophica bacterium]|nr:nucleotidyltransferase family protein [Candidatus Omnitrophota bacterium]
MNQKYKNLVIIKDNILKQREFTVLNKAFNSAKIPMVPIKGVALLFELPDYGETRSMADIDILVKKEDVFKSKAILLTLGYKIPDNDYSESYYLNQYHHLPFYNNNYMVELHWNLCPPRPNNIILPELWQKIRHLESYENTINLLSPEDTIFSLTLHLRRFNDPFSLRY